MKRLFALILACVLLCGCTSDAILDLYGIIPFRDMEYTRPDLQELDTVCQRAIDLSAASSDPDEVLDAVWDFYDVYDDYSTNYDLAYIHYHADLSDEYWQQEHDFCADNYGELDMHLEELYFALAESPLRAELEEEYFGLGYFDYYEGEGMYDETLLDDLEREQELIGQYYELSSSAEAEEYSDAWYDECALPMADILAELTLLRREMADYLGYGSYPEFAWEYYYYRDYTPNQARAYLEDIRQTLVPVYERMNRMDVWAPNEEPCSEKETYAYVRDTAKAMGGVTMDAFRAMELGGLYDIEISDKKSGLSFELFFSRYYQPYVFVSPAGTVYDKLTFAHEFGHFVNDYAADGSWAGTDVMEVFSQGMEYLSLCYGSADEALIRMKLADCLCTYVEQAAYAAFELALYDLPAEELTGEGILTLYGNICRSYGFESMDWDDRDLITVPHFYSNPMYVISYVVSNDAALQLYELELQTPGAGKECFEQNLTTEESWFLAFLEEADLQSPFGRLDEVRTLMEAQFGS